ncbi:D-ribose pyranase [Nocardia sp. ET3-3]|uniref:D-ribose pyranase n=1 Tax=Nocardia terrae TaxID=2675851 RepID=A0A7K1V5K9_9NOCA|nr:D-ribose pyranase [Nocardia terrae]MVU81914.1 D-ribose pyranase [Nocardia terrae]
MRADGLWHPRLMQILTGLGHTDTIVVADAGLPVPPGVEQIDLLWRRGEPGFLPVLRLILAEGVFESATRATELTDEATLDGMAAALAGIPITALTHEELKRRTAHARVIVRTGADTPYANVVLHAGVPF